MVWVLWFETQAGAEREVALMYVLRILADHGLLGQTSFDLEAGLIHHHRTL